jgi:hypothetical protein
LAAGLSADECSIGTLSALLSWDPNNNPAATCAVSWPSGHLEVMQMHCPLGGSVPRAAELNQAHSAQIPAKNRTRVARNIALPGGNIAQVEP